MSPLNFLVSDTSVVHSYLTVTQTDQQTTGLPGSQEWRQLDMNMVQTVSHCSHDVEVNSHGKKNGMTS